MAIQERFDRDGNVLFVTFEDGLTDAELEAFACRLAGDERIPPGRDELLDLRSVTRTGVDPSTLQRISELFGRADVSPEKSRVALVATADVAYGLSRMYQAFRSQSPLDLRVFRDMAEARRWLNLEPE